MKRFAAVLASSLVSVAASAQVKETIHVNSVEVPVKIIDRAGNPVRGLTEKNFELFDAAYPFQINGEALVPAVLPHVHAGERRKIALFIANADPDELQLDMLPKGTIVASAKTAEATKIVMEVPAIAPDTNALEVVVRRLRGDALRARVAIVAQ